jgi:AraC-like DNA-binding protein
MMEGAVIQLLAVQAATGSRRPASPRRRALTAAERDALQSEEVSLKEVAFRVGYTTTSPISRAASRRATAPRHDNMPPAIS